MPVTPQCDARHARKVTNEPMGIMFATVQYLRYFILGLTEYGRNSPFVRITSQPIARVAMLRSLTDFQRVKARLPSTAQFAAAERGYFASDFSGG
jgi:hypothetical protein